jgi:hypothetical protein
MIKQEPAGATMTFTAGAESNGWLADSTECWSKFAQTFVAFEAQRRRFSPAIEGMA